MDWSKFISKDFWTKKEISYQYVHFTNATFITYALRYIFPDFFIAMFAGLLAGIVVETRQWIGGNHKIEDAIRDLVFWTLGGITGWYI